MQLDGAAVPGGDGVALDEYTDGLAVVFKEEKNHTHYEQVAATKRSLGYSGDITVHRGPDIAAFHTAIRRGVAGVMHLENERHIRPETLTAGLANAIISDGGTVAEHERVVEIAPASEKWSLIASEGRKIFADSAVIAAGIPHTHCYGPSESRYRSKPPKARV